MTEDRHPLTGAVAFDAVMTQWRFGSPSGGSYAEPPYARLSAALHDKDTSVSDRVVLLRHALRYESLRRGAPVSIFLDGDPPNEMLRAGLVTDRRGEETFKVAADPWRPTWLTKGRPVDETAMAATRRRFGEYMGPAGDPFLRSVGRKHYRSVSQQSAVRAAIAMPPGEMLIIDLPTGEGKSLVFQLIAKVGFASAASGTTAGLVVVVVPTVTLALDHERSCGGDENHPLAYIGGRVVQNSAIKDSIVNGSQRIVFAAPEALVQSLREPIARIARAGQLGAIVVDEAHLIDGWGTGFRTEFQTLAGVLNAWRRDTVGDSAFRTIFLSATLSDTSVQTIRDLFSPERPIETVSGAAVRPEPEYWVAGPTDERSRRDRVEEAIWRLPRPLILYVTKVSDAEYWNRHLREMGFSRYDMVHGGTSGPDRDRVLSAWSESRLDIVVATSAFGLGIDYPHVRAVVHACLPETMDRFYQEVGRGGRDGCASVSLLVPDINDSRVARSLSSKKVISVARGHERWVAMFRHSTARSNGHPNYSVPIDVSPGLTEEDIDLIGERSTDWNQRTLALMARAGIIRLCGAEILECASGTGIARYENVEILDDRHEQVALWKQRVEAVRQAISASGAEAFSLLMRFSTGLECPSKLLGELYSSSEKPIAMHCSGCGVCRGDPERRLPEGLIGTRKPPWPFQSVASKKLLAMLGDSRAILVSYPVEAPPRRMLRDFADCIRRLDLYGIRILVTTEDVPAWLSQAAKSALESRAWVTISSKAWSAPLWPDGRRVAMSGLGTTPNTAILLAGAKHSPTILYVPSGIEDPSQRGRTLESVFSGGSYSFSQFIEEILS